MAACPLEGLVRRLSLLLARQAFKRLIVNMSSHLLNPPPQPAAPAEGGSSAHQREWAWYRRGGRGIKFIDRSNTCISTESSGTIKSSSTSLNKFTIGRHPFCERKKGKAGIEDD